MAAGTAASGTLCRLYVTLFLLRSAACKSYGFNTLYGCRDRGFWYALQIVCHVVSAPQCSLQILRLWYAVWLQGPRLLVRCADCMSHCFCSAVQPANPTALIRCMAVGTAASGTLCRLYVTLFLLRSAACKSCGFAGSQAFAL
ncbi:hypothetical protein [Lacrimispora saccharolytica]|nr:hypothetical protein [Lacrimispora saccharolytica]QRV18624.1 hypothetical protein I6K70_14020 [Lacrimispora saccharolytica]